MGELIFILGCNRSGTTLLQNLFRCAKDTKVIMGEIPPPILFRVEQYYDDPKLSFVGKRCGAPHIWGASMSGIDAALINSERVLSGESIFEGREEIIPWVEWMANWQRIWHIHIRRDPRDSMTSRMQKSNRYVGLPYMWKNAEAIYKRLYEIHPDRTLLVKYEELVSQPNEVMENLFETIGLEKGMEDVNDWPNTLTEKELRHRSMRWLKGPRPVDRDSVGQWKYHKTRILGLIKSDPDFADLVVEAGYDEKGWEKNL